MLLLPWQRLINHTDQPHIHQSKFVSRLSHGPLARYVKLRVEHAPGMLGTFSPPPRVSDSDMRHGTCVMHVPWRMPGSLPGVFPRSWWRGKRTRHSLRMRNPQFYVSGKRPIAYLCVFCLKQDIKWKWHVPICREWTDLYCLKSIVYVWQKHVD